MSDLNDSFHKAANSVNNITCGPISLTCNECRKHFRIEQVAHALDPEFTYQCGECGKKVWG